MYVHLMEKPTIYAEIEEEPDVDQEIRRARLNIFDIQTPDRYRNGEDIPDVALEAEEFFKPVFGLRGIDFGDWAEADFRIQSLNLTYDSFQMLAETLDMPTMGISLNDTTRLGVGFGARGRGGKAAAAFYPSNSVIGLTKTKGDGSLAHEWGHAFDFMTTLKLSNNDNPDYHNIDAIQDLKDMTQNFYDIAALEGQLEQILRGLWLNSDVRNMRKDDGRDYLKNKWEREIFQSTDFYLDALALDGLEVGKYWSNPVEMFARGFEAYIADQMQGENYYLVDVDFVAPGGVEARFNRSHGAYPTEGERDRFNDIFKQFFEGIEWSADGIPSMKKDYVPITATEKARAQKAVDDLLARLDEIYEALYSGRPSADGYYWYAYKYTERGMMMQPKGFIGYDSKFKLAEEHIAITEKSLDSFAGVGAVAYEQSLNADQMIQYSLLGVINNEPWPWVDSGKV
jgi:hypothetical protein